MLGCLRGLSALAMLLHVAAFLTEASGCSNARAPAPAPPPPAPRKERLSVTSTPQPSLAHELALDQFPGTPFFIEQIVNELAVAEMRDLHPVGSTSTVFRATLRAPFRAAFKAASRERPRGPMAEVAAYRLARCLDLPNVPPAVLRRVPKRALERGLDAASQSKWPSIEPLLAADHTGQVEGAAIFWIDGMRDVLATPAARAEVMLALRLDAAPAAQPLAAGLSDLIVFDALIGNWDRWSGGNLNGDRAQTRLYIRDNDAGFAPRLGSALEQRVLEPVHKTQRFSRQLVEHLRALAPEDFRRELAQDPGFASRAGALDPAAISGMFARREQVLAHVQALIEAHGEAEVLVFP
jgi:hypothetical protein